MISRGRLYVAALAVAAWLGAALITVAVVTPAAFAVLPSGTLSGALVGRVLPPLFIGAIVVSAIVLAAAGVPRMSGPGGQASIAAVVVAAASAIAQFVITPKLDAIRATIGGPVDALMPGDPRRVAFGLLHGYNVGGLGLAMIGGLACLVLLSLAIRPRS
ncbi:MAG TPA: DUF4149 domain-containing protein [Gemmatimonadaceae bacterium]|nr:DUF4149 domain-containing protein [Gemmatimonadaceae bacterium]